jgi:hypothetical protein
MREALRVSPFATRRFWLETGAEIGVVVEGEVEPRLGEVIHHVLGGHAEEDVAAIAEAGVRRPEGPVDEELRDTDLGALHDHHKARRIPREVCEEGKVGQGPTR